MSPFSSLPPEPSRRLAIVTCMDCRINPLIAAGIEIGEAHVIRNAGAVVTADVRRSLALSQRALGTREVWIVAHKGCGVLGLNDEKFLEQIEAETGTRPDWIPHGFSSLEDSVRRGAEEIAGDPALSDEFVRGFVLDLETNAMEEVELPASG